MVARFMTHEDAQRFFESAVKNGHTTVESAGNMSVYGRPQNVCSVASSDLRSCIIDRNPLNSVRLTPYQFPETGQNPTRDMPYTGTPRPREQTYVGDPVDPMAPWPGWTQPPWYEPTIVPNTMPVIPGISYPYPTHPWPQTVSSTDVKATFYDEKRASRFRVDNDDMPGFLYVFLDLPGVSPDTLDVFVRRGRTLVVRSQRCVGPAQRCVGPDENWTPTEETYELPRDVSASELDVKFKLGVLIVTLENPVRDGEERVIVDPSGD